MLIIPNNFSYLITSRASTGGISYESIKSQKLEQKIYFTAHHIKPFETDCMSLIGSGSMIFQSLWNSSKDRTNIIYGIQREAVKFEQFREE